MIILFFSLNASDISTSGVKYRYTSQRFSNDNILITNAKQMALMTLRLCRFR